MDYTIGCMCDVPSSDLKTVPRPRASVWVKLEPSSRVQRRGNQCPLERNLAVNPPPSSAGMLSVTGPAFRMAAEHEFLKHNLFRFCYESQETLWFCGAVAPGVMGRGEFQFLLGVNIS